MARAFDEENVGGSSGAESESKDPKTDRLDILLYWQIKYRKGAWFLAATFNRLSKPFLPNIVRHIWLPGGDAKASVSPPIWKLNLTTLAIRHNVWQLQQIGQTIAKGFHFCPLFVSLNTSLSGNLHTFSSPFQRYPTCLISVCACCWSTVLWTARRTWRRRPGRSLTLGCINSVGIFFNEDVIQPWIHWPPWSSFPGCSRRPKCRRPPTHMSFMLSHTLKVNKKELWCQPISPQHITSKLKKIQVTW